MLNPSRILYFRKPMMQGEDVLEVQTRLGKLGYTISADGKYGRVTASVIRQFQKNQGLKETGEVNQSTYELLFGGLT